eukprot:4911132-Pyramimonas_sp.AAC.1
MKLILHAIGCHHHLARHLLIRASCLLPGRDARLLRPRVRGHPRPPAVVASAIQDQGRLLGARAADVLPHAHGDVWDGVGGLV